MPQSAPFLPQKRPSRRSRRLSSFTPSSQRGHQPCTKTEPSKLEVILELVKKCPEPLQEKCFAILLQGYVDAERFHLVTPPTAGVAPVPAAAEQAPAQPESGLPQAVRGRFAALAKRLGVEQEQVEQLFDFTSDPFGYSPFDAPGANNADKTRNVALLVAARTYLATGSWTADWSEVKALSIDLSCYDAANHAAYLRKGEGKYFRAVEVGKTIELSGSGRQAAEQLLKDLITAAGQ